MAKIPSAVWIVDPKKEHLAVSEARKLNIPIVAILDTNADPDEVDYRIPGNDDAIRAVALLTRVIADAAAEGLVARSASKKSTGEESETPAEPLAEWERELLDTATQEVTVTEEPGEVVAQAPAAEELSTETPAESETPAPTQD